MNLVKLQDIILMQRNQQNQQQKIRKINSRNSPIYHSIKKNKILRNKPTYGNKNLYFKNYNTLVKETKDHTGRWKHILCSWIRWLNIVKMTILPRAIYRFNEISVKLPMAFFIELEQKNLKICMKTQKTLNGRRNLQTINTGENVEKREPSYTVGGNINSYSHNGVSSFL